MPPTARCERQESDDPYQSPRVAQARSSEIAAAGLAGALEPGGRARRRRNPRAPAASRLRLYTCPRPSVNTGPQAGSERGSGPETQGPEPRPTAGGYLLAVGHLTRAEDRDTDVSETLP